MKKIIIVFISLIGLIRGLELNAQVLSIDTTFQPFFDLKQGLPGDITDIWENPSNGKLYLVGTFAFYTSSSVRHEGITSTLRNGDKNNDFNGMLGGPFTNFFPLNDSIYIVIQSNHVVPIDSTGTRRMLAWKTNYNNSVPCEDGRIPYFFPDGSSLMGNFKGNVINGRNACSIIIPPDTFPHRYIMKLDPQGYWDSTFTKDANAVPRGYVPYDSNRILMYGLPRSLTMYDGKTINGICRIFLDGTLDTTFKSPLSSLPMSGGFTPSFIEEDGGFFLMGNFKLKNDTHHHTLVRLNADGSLDSTFLNYQAPTDSLNYISFVHTMAKTPDGGYIIGGGFELHQGLVRNNISKIDSNGLVDPNYFNGLGPDSSFILGTGYAAIYDIIPSAFGGYYVAGDFLKWDGKPSQPIVRLHGLLSGIEENNINSFYVDVFPNPSAGEVTVRAENKIREIQIFDAYGKFVKSIEGVNNKEFTIHITKANGLYLINLLDVNGNYTSLKLIKNSR